MSPRRQGPPTVRPGPRHRLLLAAAILTGCGGTEPPQRTLDVFAASSLAESFTEIAARFESAHPGTHVALTFAGSQVLRLQIEQGAAADVYASADPGHVSALVQSGSLRDERVFAHNQLVVIVPLDNPAGITSFADLVRAERLVIGGDNVPVGRYTREALRRASGRLGPGFEDAVLSRIASEETNVRLVRAKVELGEADAAVVYRTDAVASDRVRCIPIPPGIDVRADYWMGVVARSPHPGLAQEWLEMVASPEGRDILTRRGFGVD